MRSIDITRPHALTHAQALDLVQDIADDIAEQYAASYQWVGDVLRFERPGIKGAVHILPKQVHIRAELGFLMTPLRGMIEAHIINFLDEHSGATDPSHARNAIQTLAGKTLTQTSKSPITTAHARPAAAKKPAAKPRPVSATKPARAVAKGSTAKKRPSTAVKKKT